MGSATVGGHRSASLRSSQPRDEGASLGPRRSPRASARASGAVGGAVGGRIHLGIWGICARASRARAERGRPLWPMLGREVDRGEVELHQVDPLRRAGGEIALEIEGNHGLGVQQRQDHRQVECIAQQPHAVLGCKVLDRACTRERGRGHGRGRGRTRRTRRTHAAMRHGRGHSGRNRSGDPVHCSRAGRRCRRCRHRRWLRRKRRVRRLRGELVQQLGGEAREELAAIWAGEGAVARDGRRADHAGHRGCPRLTGRCDLRHGCSSGRHGRSAG